MQHEEQILAAIRRSSVSRRLQPLSLPDACRQRARSAERNIPEPDSDTEVGASDDRSPRRFTRIDSDPLDSTGDAVTSQSESSLADSGAETTAQTPPQDSAFPNEKPHHNHVMVALPTLPRYPIAETKNQNCWSEPHASKCFKVRGPNYTIDKKKISSGPYIFPARGADLILTNQFSGPGTDIALRHSVLAGRVRSMPTFIINFCFPWGVLVNYYEIPKLYSSFLEKKENGETIHDELLECLAPHERTIIRFLTGDDEHRQSKLKLIPVCIEGPWVVKQMVAGKPAIIGKRLPVAYKYHPADKSRGIAECFEADLDISASDPVGKKVVKLCRSYMTSVTVDIGVVIEGAEDDELPEQMLGCIRLHKLDALLAPTLPPS
ncbi:hypothetical protein HJC23_001685 [Cyclotella cryptica]|uniref:Protein ENHANCED DISEASE RESISTANCE 2 C-terminal domain-containing protein n=1 Tax=Cyclotella cryptica TaxID=29204 RepID=A0ABD3QLI2_9STRA|eukprot:CCRYP_004720-RA/>CCRYP_004720-RA protein AED:0.15 eAED:0.15 QI:246/1/1/1/1/1/2/1784/377